jgi:RimJ/RimL family protein N-acetyltransferase
MENTYLLQSDTVVLRPVHFLDIFKFYASLKDPEVYLPIDLEKPPSLLDEIRWFTSLRQGKEGIVWTILYKNEVVGNCRLFDFKESREKSCELGIMIDKKYWGKGIGRNVCRLLIHFAKEQLKFDKVVLTVKQTNVRAISLYKKLGFETVEMKKNHLFMELKIK